MSNGGVLPGPVIDPDIQLADEIATIAASIDAAKDRLLTLIRRFDEAGGWGKQGALSCAHWLSWRIGLSPGAAREQVRVAKALGGLPKIDEALSRGTISYSKVRAMTRVATPQNESTLLDMATHATGAELEKICRGARKVKQAQDREQGVAQPATELPRRSVRVRSTLDGMVLIEAVLERDEAALVLKSLQLAREDLREGEKERRGSSSDVSAETPVGESPANAQCDSRPGNADALVAVAESYLAHAAVKGSGGDRTLIFVHLSQEQLGPEGQLAATLEDGSRVSAETFRRLACDSGLVPVAVDDRGNPLDVGRKTRKIPSALRRALEVRDRKCQFPGCTNTIYVHGHHLDHWIAGGETKLDNVALLCSPHHHLVHEGGWKVDRDEETGELRFRAPQGDRIPRVWKSPEADDATLAVYARELGITAATNEPKGTWGGFDLGWAVEAVVGPRPRRSAGAHPPQLA